MSGLGIDIKEVYDELGGSFSVVNRIGTSLIGKVIYDLNAQATKPFIREHHLDATFSYDTVVLVGDVILLEEVSRHYMVMNKTPEMFEDEVVKWSAVLYLCNLPTTTHILRPIEVRNPDTYNMTSGWSVVADSPVYGLLTDRLFGSEINQEEGAGQFPIWRRDIYLPKAYAVKPLDRVVISETEFYKIETMQEYNFPGVNQILLVEDTRPNATIIDGDVIPDDED
jgi:hypothetical protein